MSISEISIYAKGYSELWSCISHLAIILEHMYKWDNLRSFTSGGVKRGGKGWIRSIKSSRREIEKLFDKSPSLRKRLPDYVPIAWKWAKRAIHDWLEERGISHISLPEKCPYTYEEAMEKHIG